MKIASLLLASALPVLAIANPSSEPDQVNCEALALFGKSAAKKLSEGASLSDIMYEIKASPESKSFKNSAAAVAYDAFQYKMPPESIYSQVSFSCKEAQERESKKAPGKPAT